MRPGLLLVLPLAWAAICPQEKHAVCNEGHADHSCVCGVTAADENSVPYQSCNNMITLDEEENFKTVAVKFNVEESTDGLDEFPEDDFREAISNTLRVDEDDVLILRQACQDDNKAFVIQFAILKKDLNESSLPYEEDDFLDAESIATRMKGMGHLSQIADIDVDSIEFTEELVDIEQDPDNSVLIIQAIVVGLSFSVMFALGCVLACRKKEEYQDDLQKP